MSGQEPNKRGNPLASPEELSQRIAIADAKGKVAVAMGVVLALALLAWSIFGSAPEMVLGSGILVPPQGLMDVVALGQGQITEVDVARGDTVARGDILARIAMPTLEAEWETTLTNLKSAKLWTQERQAYYGRTKDVQGRNNEERITHLRFRMSYLQSYFTFLEQQVKQFDALEKGYIAPKEIETTRKNMQSVLAEINDCSLKIAEIKAAEMDLADKADQDLLQSRKQESQQALALESVERQLQQFSNVRSPYDGVVVELAAERGDYVQPGKPLFTLRPVESPLEATLLFPVDAGKRIKPGMVVYVYPSTAPKEEYGCIYGLIASISEYPVSAESLMQSIGSRQLINSLMEQGVMLQATVSLLRDPSTPSGFKWSSSAGPESGIEAGTVCTGDVVLKRNRPIDLVFPKFSKMLGLAKR